MYKVAIIEKIHNDGLELLKNNPDYEFEKPVHHAHLEIFSDNLRLQTKVLQNLLELIKPKHLEEFENAITSGFKRLREVSIISADFDAKAFLDNPEAVGKVSELFSANMMVCIFSPVFKFICLRRIDEFHYFTEVTKNTFQNNYEKVDLLVDLEQKVTRLFNDFATLPVEIVQGDSTNCLLYLLDIKLFENPKLKHIRSSLANILSDAFRYKSFKPNLSSLNEQDSIETFLDSCSFIDLMELFYFITNLEKNTPSDFEDIKSKEIKFFFDKSLAHFKKDSGFDVYSSLYEYSSLQESKLIDHLIFPLLKFSPSDSMSDFDIGNEFGELYCWLSSLMSPSKMVDEYRMLLLKIINTTDLFDKAAKRVAQFYIYLSREHHHLPDILGIKKATQATQSALLDICLTYASMKPPHELWEEVRAANVL